MKRQTMGKSEPDDLERAERRLRAVQLRSAGASYEEIGQMLGVAKTTAFNDVKHYLNELDTEARHTARELRQLQALHLLRIQKGLANAAYAGNTRAADSAARIHDRLARLFGLDEPTTFKVEYGGIDIEALDAQIDQMMSDVEAFLGEHTSTDG